MSSIQDFEFHVDLLAALLWCQNDATALQTIMSKKQDWYNLYVEDFWSNWYRDVFNIDTASRFGLNVWSIILGIELGIQLGPARRGRPAFGFGKNYRNFKNGNYTSIQGSVTRLSDSQARLLLKLRYRQLISRPTVPYINKMLKDAFSEYGNVYVLDPLNMTFVVYVFDFEPGSQIKRMLKYFDVLPRPSGVGVEYRVVAQKPFGFGNANKNFFKSNFYSVNRVE